MKRFIYPAVLLAFVFSSPSAWSQDSPPAKKPNPQHQRMKACHAEAKAQALKGDERKAFVGQCLKAKK